MEEIITMQEQAYELLKSKKYADLGLLNFDSYEKSL
jgi:hypothetical protein